jgi:hypothetical protein
VCLKYRCAIFMGKNKSLHMLLLFLTKFIYPEKTC